MPPLVATTVLAPPEPEVQYDCGSADVAQLVERNLAKVEVAGSNPVVRSAGGRRAALHGAVAEWFRQGSAKPSTRVRFPAAPPA